VDFISLPLRIFIMLSSIVRECKAKISPLLTVCPKQLNFISLERLIRHKSLKLMLIFFGIGILLFLGCSSSLQSQVATDFNNDSLKGNYALIDKGNGGQPNAGVTLINFDGRGKFTGSTTQNFPGANAGTRTIAKATFTGNYTLEKQGIGTGQIITNLPDGSTSENKLNLVVTKAKIIDQKREAEELFLIPQNLTPANGLETVVAKRLPDEGKFTNASLQGNYSYNIIGEGGQSPIAGLGILTCDGKGNCSGNIAINRPGASAGERTVTTTSSVMPYTINSDGTGTATPPNESEIVLLITKAEVVNDLKVAQEMFFIVNQLDSATGNLLKGFVTKISD
jgi:hypothetical protein